MRKFTSQNKKILFAISEGYCQCCGTPLEKNWHADHILPFSKFGQTNLLNGQALCPKCNLYKSNNIIMKTNKTLRQWQTDCYKELLRVKADGRNKFLSVAGVGSGKTFFSAFVFNEFRSKGEFDSVVIISPTENIKRNWSITFQYDFNLKVDHGYQFKHSWPRDCHGVSLTYQSLNPLNLQVLKRYITRKVFLIIDEVHHAGDERSWGNAIQELGDEAGFVLLLSGTPTRGDNSPIPFVTYQRKNPNEEGTKTYELKYDFYYSYAESIKDKVCCPTIFPRNFSNVQTIEGYKKLEYADQDSLEMRKLYNNIISVKEEGIGCYVYETFIRANKQLCELNDKRNQNFAGLIVCNTIPDAIKLHERIYKEFGADFVELVTSNDPDSSKKIENFKFSYCPWIISINMISEGVDISRIRVIVYASNVISPVRFIQVMGRGVRNPQHKENDSDVCYMYIPDYKPLVENARKIELEIKHEYEELTESLKKEKNSTESIQMNILDDIILNASSENSGLVFSSMMFDVKEDLAAISLAKKYDVTKDKVLSMWKDILEMTGKPTPEERPKKIETITDEKEKYRRVIQKVVAKLHYDFGLDFKEIHLKLNEQLGKIFSNDLTLDELKQKYALAQKYYEKYRSMN